ncbi:MAG: OmpA family protein [Myxococcota bacterium]
MSLRSFALASLSFACAACFVPKSRLDEQQLETDSCYEALEQENTRKRELSGALDELKTAMAKLASERKRLAAEKGELEGDMESLEKEVQDKIDLVENLAREKAALEAERAALVAKTETYDSLVDSLRDEMKAKLIEVKRKGQRITVNVSDQILFSSGSIEIKDRGQIALKKIAAVLAKVDDKRIDIEGHTDSVPISGELAEQFPSNWELSALRATNVVRYLQDNGVSANRLAAVGMSQYRPRARNTSSKGRRLNRRIEIVLTPWKQ